MNCARLTRLLLPAIVIVSTGSSQTARTPLAPVPANQRVGLISRLNAYTMAFRKKDWAGLYDLVSDENKIRAGKLKVNRRMFIRDMQGTYDLQRLIKFTPLKTEVISQGIFNIYGCGELPSGDEKIERIAAVRAVWEHGNWYFTNWDYPDPPEPCSNLSDSAWKPARYLQQLDGPMLQLSCELNICTL
jgi:hypothetical protein